MNRFGHVDLRVSSLEAALPFYEALLPALGFTQPYHSPDIKAWGTTDALPAAAYFAFSEEAGYQPNSTRIAFWAQSPAEVDELAAVVVKAGGRNVEGPEKQPYFGSYYAVYFEDPCGNRFEIYHRVIP